MSWVIAVIDADDASRSVLVDPPAAGDGSGVAHLPIVELPPGEPKADQVADAIERLLDRPIMPIWTPPWMHPGWFERVSR